MIIVFPMLVSRAVSENSIPGIAKTIENYIIIHFQDMVINNADIKKQTNSVFALKGGKLFVKESADLLEAIPTDATPGNKKDQTRSPKKTSAEEETEEERLKRTKQELEDERDKLEKRQREKTKQSREDRDDRQKQAELAARKARSDVKASDTKSISLEPTYITIEHSDQYGNKSSSFIGIKVVPIRVKSDVKLSHLLLYDTKINALFAAGIALGRMMLKKIYTFIDKWTRRLRIGGLTPSGDPRRDILMGRTGMGKDSESFIVLSKQEDVDEVFLDNVQKINRLFNMGWGNFVIADDVGRVAYFCMRKFRGMCSAVPYAMMYQYLGQTKAYESMEDAKKANSSIFKVGKRFSRVIGEWRVVNKISKYSQLSEDHHNE